MPEQIRRETPTPQHKQGKIPAWENIPKPDIDDIVNKINKAGKKPPPKREEDPSPCGCW
jgi:hypothetical protein